MLTRTQNGNNVGLSGPPDGTPLCKVFHRKTGNATNATDRSKLIRFAPTTQAGTPFMRVVNNALLKSARVMNGVLRFDGDDAFDLDRHAVRKRAHADRRAGVPSGVAEHLDEQVGAAVDHLGLVLEVGRRVDHAKQLHDVVDPVERARRRVAVTQLWPSPRPKKEYLVGAPADR